MRTTRGGIVTRVRRCAGLATTSCLFVAVAAGTSNLSAPAVASGLDPRDGGSSGTHIVWSQFNGKGNTAHLVVSRPNGAHVRILTHPPAGDQDINPAVSPNGRLIAFERDFPDGSAAIGLVRLNGTREHQLTLGCTDPCFADVDPTWTPDGRHIVFTPVIGPFDGVNGSARSAVLWTSDLHGRYRHRLSQTGIDGTFEDYRATFAPQGYIVFLRIRNSDIKSAAFRMNLDGTGVRRLTPWWIDADELSVSPAPSGPTANRVVFETYGHGAPDGVAQAVATVSATAGPRSIHLLTSPNSLPVQHFNPGWSPDGRRIVYVKFAFHQTTQTIRGDIWTMRWNGGDRRPVSQSPRFEFRPAWGAAPQS